MVGQPLRRGSRRAVQHCLLALAPLAVAGLTLASCGSPGGEHEPAVGGTFFGINGQVLWTLPSQKRTDELGRHLDAIEDTGVEFVRSVFDWRGAQPLPPGSPQHRLDFSTYDLFAGELAKRGLRWQISGFFPVPRWASDPELLFECGSRAPPADPATYAAFMSEFGRRYGRRGTFWREHPDLPYKPVTDYEVWNEPNHGAFWCPRADPERYARLFLETREAIKEIDPRARVMLGGLSNFGDTHIRVRQGVSMPPDRFLSEAIAAEPDLRRKVDVVAAHIYAPTPQEVLDGLASYRDFLEKLGMGEVPMSLNETGWPTQGEGAISEDQRAAYIRELTEAIPRTNCNLISFAPHTWLDREMNPADRTQWFGLAEPGSADPRPSADAYREAVMLMRGQGSEAPPRERLQVCGDD